MTGEQDQAADMPDDGPPLGDLPLGTLLQRLFQSGRAMLQAERDLAVAQAGVVASAGRLIAILVFIALAVAFGLIVALMVGTVLVLAPHVGAEVALVIVTLSTLVLLLACALAIKAQVDRIKAVMR